MSSERRSTQRLMVVGGRVFTADPQVPWAEAVVVDGARLTCVGTRAEAEAAAGPDAARFEIHGGLVLPGFVDGHVHVTMTGAALGKAHLRDARDLAEIHRRLQEWREANPVAPRVLGTNWVHGSIPDATPTKEMLDGVVSDVPAYLQAYDFHSMWVNSAALTELGITDETPDPIGGRIVRDPATGEATGWLLETAQTELVWPLLSRVSAAEIDDQVDRALRAFAENGITSVVEMALDADGLDALVRAEADGRLLTRVVAHMFVHRTGDPDEELDQVERVAALARRHTGDWLRVAGIKLVSDGTVDGCTAAMLLPYTTGSNEDPIWDSRSMNAVVEAADAAGLQIAIHAIGDRAIRQAIDALEAAAQVNGTSGRRHRIEHLEVTDEADLGRLAKAGIVASMQPVHADPEILSNWSAMLGPERTERGFAWPRYLEDGGTLVFGTDTPTAPFEPLPNVYIAATRRSPKDPDLDPLRPDWALPLDRAIGLATREPAWAAGLENTTGVLRPGMAADLTVVDTDFFAEGHDALLSTRVDLTMVDGRVTHGTDPRLT